MIVLLFFLFYSVEILLEKIADNEEFFCQLTKLIARYTSRSDTLPADSAVKL